MHPTLFCVASLMPMETMIPLAFAVLLRRSTSLPGTVIDAAASLWKKSCPRIGAVTAAHTGNAGMNVSGKAMSCAPFPAASRMREQALSTVARVLKKFGAT